MSPHMPSRCPHGVTLLPCVTARCYCGAATSHDISTTPKVALAVNIPPHARSSHSGEGTARVSLNQDEALEDEDGCVWSCRPAWGLLGCHQLPILPVGRGGRHGYLLLESREINLLLPQSGQVMFQIQERVPITSFEDWIRSLKVAHHLHRAGLPCGRIYQWAAVVLQL